MNVYDRNKAISTANLGINSRIDAILKNQL